MSGRKLVNANYNSSTDWKDETESKNVLKKGEYNLVFTDMTATAIDQILEGSSIEIAGVVYVFDTDYSPTGTPADGIVYLYIEESGGVAVGVWTATPPAVYNFERKGFYDSGGTKRYVYRAVKASAVYTDKVIMEGMIPKSNTITSLYDGVANVDKTLQFASDAKIYWDESEDEFVINNNARIAGGLSVDGAMSLGATTFTGAIIDKNGNEVVAMRKEKIYFSGHAVLTTLGAAHDIIIPTSMSTPTYFENLTLALTLTSHLASCGLYGTGSGANATFGTICHFEVGTEKITNAATDIGMMSLALVGRTVYPSETVQATTSVGFSFIGFTFGVNQLTLHMKMESSNSYTSQDHTWQGHITVEGV